jgi:hypothetical protein
MSREKEINAKYEGKMIERRSDMGKLEDELFVLREKLAKKVEELENGLKENKFFLNGNIYTFKCFEEKDKPPCGSSHDEEKDNDYKKFYVLKEVNGKPPERRILKKAKDFTFGYEVGYGHEDDHKLPE